MIQRIYIHNYRCFENFDLKIEDESSVLVLGRNGSGKSSLGSALRIIQSIARGNNRTRQVLKRADFAFGRTDNPMRIEMSVVLGGDVFDFGVSFDYPENFKEAKIAEESLKVNSKPVYPRKDAEVNLANGPHFWLIGMLWRCQ